MPSLRAMDAKVRIDVREVQLGALFAEPLSPLKGVLTLQGGVLRIDDLLAQAAALAFYAVLSLAPLLLIVISVAGLFFGEAAARAEILGQLVELVGEDSAGTVNAVLDTLNRAEVPASRIYSAEDMLSDPQFLAREMFLSAKLPDGKPFKMPGIVPKLSDTPGGVDWVGPTLGEHNQQVLSSLGYSSEQIAALRREGSI